MAALVSARAWANNEVAYVAWAADGRIPGCLGFEVTRVIVGNDGSLERVKCATWVPFKGQRNPDWLPQDAGVWPVQKFSWRDLTARKKRDGMRRRPGELTLRYEVRALGRLKPGLEPVPSNGREQAWIAVRDAKGEPVRDTKGKIQRVKGPAYQGKPRPLAYLGPAVVSNDVHITTRRGPFRSTFTNGILSAQWLSNVLDADGTIGRNELLDKLRNPKDPHRKYLAGDVLPLMHELFARPGRFLLALYELEDEELEEILVANAARVQVILANTGEDAKGEWDARNAPARRRLKKAQVVVQDRMFNNATHIGHNKFVVHLDGAGTPLAVFTGSTNWTSTGLAGQTNNALLIEDPAVARIYADYWALLQADVLPAPTPKISSPMTRNQPGAALRLANAGGGPELPMAGGGQLRAWFSPNRPERSRPAGAKAATPPDLVDVYRLIRGARRAVLFLAFYPSQRGADSIIAEAVNLGLHDPAVLVTGAVSSSQAMPNYDPASKGDQPATFDQGNVSIVRAARIDEKTLLGDLNVEPLTAYGGIGAIIHDKILVIDPHDPQRCAVVLGSHNLGFKASYSNDENLVIVQGQRELAQAYAVHVLDVFDHYRFRAIENDLARQGKEGWSGFLDITDKWQNGYVSGRKGAMARYVAASH
jgi:phosphatidylserine/phosphatidylglycerophosphate/cardiolipin synthase-like enzyme